MLTLITGTPGAGKTAWTVQELTRLPSQRKLYIHGIPELKIAHEPIYCLSELCEHCRSLTHLVEKAPVYDSFGVCIQEGYQCIEEINKPGQPVYLVEEWPDWASHGSLIVIDEVQRVWRPATKLPDEIAALETHRHKGLDFWLISQGPHLFHSNIRLLIGRHIHLVDAWRGRKEYEFAECRQNVNSRSDAVERPYKLPKHIFGMYKSASIHTKINHRKPLSYYLMLGAIAMTVLLAVNAYRRFSAKFEQPAAKPVEAVATAGPEARARAEAPGPDAATASQGNNGGYPDFKPTIPGVPESAPAYLPLLQVKAVPLLVGCVQNKDKCNCYTAQGTIYPTTPVYCAETVKGHRFNPYQKVPNVVNPVQRPALDTLTANPLG